MCEWAGIVPERDNGVRKHDGRIHVSLQGGLREEGGILEIEYRGLREGGRR